MKKKRNVSEHTSRISFVLCTVIKSIRNVSLYLQILHFQKGHLLMWIAPINKTFQTNLTFQTSLEVSSLIGVAKTTKFK